MSSHLSVPMSVERQANASPLPLDGQCVPPPSSSPLPSPSPAPMQDDAAAAAASAAAPASADASMVDVSQPRRHAAYPPLSADEERAQFTALYDPAMPESATFAVLPQKWFDSWVAYSGFDRPAIDLLRSQGVRPGAAPAAGSSSSAMDSDDLGEGESGIGSRRAGGGERPGYIDCSPLLVDPPADVDLSAPGLRSHWIELRPDVQESVDFTLINYDAYTRLLEWYGGGPTILRTVVLVGLSQMEMVDLHPLLLLLTPIEGPAPGRIATEARRLKPFPKSATLASVIEECKPSKMIEQARHLPPEQRPAPAAQPGAAAAAAAAKSESNDAAEAPLPSATEARAWVEGRIWKKRDVAASANAEGAAAAPATAATAIAAAALSPEEFVTSWEIVQKAELAQKLEYLELASGQEYVLEFRLSVPGAQWVRYGNGQPSSQFGSPDYFRVGTIFDCLDPEGKWFEASVLEAFDDPARGGPCIKVHYLGWSTKYDEVIPLSDENVSKRMREKNCRTNGPHIPNIKKKEAAPEPAYMGYSSMARQNAVGEPEVRGAVGLRNLGNTCFMNSTLQCLANTPGLTEFFVEGRYTRFLNRTNPLGFKGKIAEEYGALLSEMWSGKYSVVTPRGIKQAVGEFQPRFSGYSQQDSSELLAFVLDGLHEDLNRVLQKPATAPVESNGRPDDVVAAESWERHLQRNRSVIVDNLQGQLKSRVVCPQCKRESITFDPFMFLSVPLPVVSTREQPVTLIMASASADAAEEDNGNATFVPPYQWPLKLGAGGTIGDMKGELVELVRSSPEDSVPELATAPEARTLLVAEIYQNKIFKVLADRAECSRINKQDHIVAYHVPELLLNEPGQPEVSTTLQCIHLATSRPMPKRVGVPMVLALPTAEMRAMKMSTLRRIVRAAVAPWLRQGAGWQRGEDDRKLYNIVLMDRAAENIIQTLPVPATDGGEDPVVNLLDLATSYYQRQRLNSVGMSFAVDWSVSGTEGLTLLSKGDALPLPTHIASARASVPRKVGLDLSDCLQAFAKEEKLRASEAWYCSACKAHMEATKKFDLWKLPDILVIHLKRFVYDSYRRDKIDAYVDFPLQNLDLSPFMVGNSNGVGAGAAARSGGKAPSSVYDLYAVSNHYGGMGGGHYTAYARNLINQRWYDLDDSSVTPLQSPEQCKTNAAYVLFYRRRGAKFQNQ